MTLAFDQTMSHSKGSTPWSSRKTPLLEYGAPWEDFVEPGMVDWIHREFLETENENFPKNKLCEYPVGRDVHLVEIFCGSANLSKTFIQEGWRVRSYDLKLDDIGMNFLTDLGFKQAIIWVLSIPEGGLMWCAPQCSTWVWMSRKQSKRTKLDPLGNLDNENVINANKTISKLVVILKICVVRGVKFVIEQPTSSLLFEHPEMRALFRAMDDHWRLHVYFGNHGHMMVGAR